MEVRQLKEGASKSDHAYELMNGATFYLFDLINGTPVNEMISATPLLISSSYLAQYP